MTTNVSRETFDLFLQYENLVGRWNRSINLVSQSTLAAFRTRHIEDSLQLLDTLESVPSSWADLGSGGGLPGLVVAIALRSTPTCVTMVESDARKSAFLRTAARELDLPNVTVLNARIEAVPPLGFDVVSARALAPLGQLLSWLDRHMRADGRAIFPKGRTWRDEIAAAQQHWQFHYDAIPSRTDPDAVILKISKVARA